MAKIKALRVVSKAASFRRAGYQFTGEPKDIPVSELDEQQRAAIDGDPALVSFEIEIDDPIADGDGAKISKTAKK
ncbi:hypothetical protein [Undibacterium sp. TJN19]|uniref:hypothetical protein n=1 Tax=Undibacterium sp. TJN19 TaxID=3413055 RepID=UPI003BF30E73